MGRPWQEQNDLRQFSQRDPRHVLLTARRARCDFKTGQGSCDRSRGKSLAAVCGSGRFMSAACSRSYRGRWGVVASSRLCCAIKRAAQPFSERHTVESCCLSSGALESAGAEEHCSGWARVARHGRARGVEGAVDQSARSNGVAPARGTSRPHTGHERKEKQQTD